MRFSIDFCRSKTKANILAITTDANNTVSQSELEAIACSRRQARGKIHLSKTGLDLVLVVIGWESAGASFLFNHREQQCKTKTLSTHFKKFI